MLGEFAVVRTPLTPERLVFFHGERWKAALDHGTAQPGQTVRIVGADGLRLTVHKEEES